MGAFGSEVSAELRCPKKEAASCSPIRMSNSRLSTRCAQADVVMHAADARVLVSHDVDGRVPAVMAHHISDLRMHVSAVCDRGLWAPLEIEMGPPLSPPCESKLTSQVLLIHLQFVSLALRQLLWATSIATTCPQSRRLVIPHLHTPSETN